MDELGPAHHWVADRSAARRAATAMLVRELRHGRLPFFAAASLIGLTLLFLIAGKTEEDHDPSLAFLFALGLTAFLVGCSVGIAQLQRRKIFRSQLPPGLELTSRFGPDYLVLITPWAEVRMMFDGFAAVEVERGWVMLLQRGRRVRSLYPQELFPADDLARLRLVVAGYQPRVAEETPGAPADVSEAPERPAPRHRAVDDVPDVRDVPEVPDVPGERGE
jgi:hypothetical protein